ncbi:MAG: hypothetical protein ABJC87_22035 [Roseobacter sp.]
MTYASIWLGFSARQADHRWIADRAYGFGPMLGWPVDRDIKSYIPVLDKAGRTDKKSARATPSPTLRACKTLLINGTIE